MSNVDRLLRDGASVSTKDASNGWSALHYAAARCLQQPAVTAVTAATFALAPGRDLLELFAATRCNGCNGCNDCNVSRRG